MLRRFAFFCTSATVLKNFFIFHVIYLVTSPVSRPAVKRFQVYSNYCSSLKHVENIRSCLRVAAKCNNKYIVMLTKAHNIIYQNCNV